MNFCYSQQVEKLRYDRYIMQLSISQTEHVIEKWIDDDTNEHISLSRKTLLSRLAKENSLHLIYSFDGWQYATPEQLSILNEYIDMTLLCHKKNEILLHLLEEIAQKRYYFSVIDNALNNLEKEIIELQNS
jgi:hypothetical protein